MASLTRATKTMSLDELLDVLQEHKANYRNLRKSIDYMKRQVDSATTRRDQRRVGVLITAGMYNDGVTVSRTLAYLNELDGFLSVKRERTKEDIQRLQNMKTEVSQKYKIAKALLEMIEAGETPQAIESKMARNYSGEYRWKGILDPRDFMQVNLYFKNLEVTSYKNQALHSLRRIVDAVVPEDESKPKGICNLEAIENKLEETTEELECIAIMRMDVYKLIEATKKLREKLDSIAQ